jgi:hypothetical protein
MTARQLWVLMVCAFAFAAGCSSSSSADTRASIAESTATVAGTAAPVAGPTPEPSVSENLYGVWASPDNSNPALMTFNEDDTWTMTHKENPELIRDSGPFTFDGELLTFFTDPASRHCSRNSGVYDAEITGTYGAVITPEGNLELTDVDDACVQRKVGMRGKTLNADQPHQSGILVPYSP